MIDRHTFQLYTLIPLHMWHLIKKKKITLSSNSSQVPLHIWRTVAPTTTSTFTTTTTTPTSSVIIALRRTSSHRNYILLSLLSYLLPLPSYFLPLPSPSLATPTTSLLFSHQWVSFSSRPPVPSSKWNLPFPPSISPLFDLSFSLLRWWWLEGRRWMC